MSYSLAVFDMDGTILDTLDDMTDAINAVLSKNAYPIHTRNEVRSFIGNGIPKLIERALPEGTSQSIAERILFEFKTYYQAHCAEKTAPYHGIVTLLKHLRDAGIKTAVVSNKPDAAVHTLCKQYFNGLFDAVAGDKDGFRRKPAPDLGNAILDILHISADQTVYIGDSDVDILTARACKFDEILVAWGFRDPCFLAEHGAKRVVFSSEELESALLSN